MNRLCEWLGVSFKPFIAWLVVSFMSSLAFQFGGDGPFQVLCGIFTLVPTFYVQMNACGDYFERLTKVLFAGAISFIYILIGFETGAFFNNWILTHQSN